MICVMLSTVMLAATPPPTDAGPRPRTLARYAVLTCKPDTLPPFETVDLSYSPTEAAESAAASWFQIQGRTKEADIDPALEIQMLIGHDPLRTDQDVPILRYLVRVPETGEALEYRNMHTRRALLPPWGRFQQHFLPHAAQGSPRRDGFPKTATYLGHVLTLKEIRHDAAWKPVQGKVLDLDPELLVGTARNFKDAEGRRVQTSEKNDYTYVRFTAEDYATMIAAGSNIFMIGPEQESFVRDEPVFYVRSPSGKGISIRWPSDLYRSNYLGPQMFMDEPAIITVGDKQVNTKMQSFGDFATVVCSRVHEKYSADIYTLDKLLRDRKANLGDMRVEAYDCPIWETLYETAFYQMAGGGSGIIHEGRYHLDSFTKEIARRALVKRKYTVEEMLRYYYGTLRGGTRPFGKHWGTSIYGQCDPKIAPAAVTQAYDMGARYIWFWTSDHEHHLPWNEQMELTRTLRKHAREHLRPSIFAPPPTRDVAIIVPYGHIVSLEAPWFIRELDPKIESEAATRYRRFLNRVFEAINGVLDQHEDFDISVDDGREMTGYKRIVRIDDKP
jgi:hypothetical protein